MRGIGENCRQTQPIRRMGDCCWVKTKAGEP
jgi:hypothetical protein